MRNKRPRLDLRHRLPLDRAVVGFPYEGQSDGRENTVFRGCSVLAWERVMICAVGATNPNSTISESGHPQPTFSGFFVSAVWATNPGKHTNELHIHADHGGSVPAFAAWLRGPNKSARVNKARLLSEVVDAMPHPNLQHGRLTEPREILAMIYTFLIQHSRICRLADLRRIRTISAVADTEAQARAALAGLPLVFLSRTPRKGEAA
jgi:hypothetical protein